MANQYPLSAVAVDSTGKVTTTTYTYGSPVVAKTADYQVQASDSGTFFTTRGAAGSVTFTLPALQAGLEFRFNAFAAFAMAVTATSALIVGCGGAAFAAGTAPSPTPASSLSVAGGTAADRYTTLTLVCDGTNWFLTNIQGGGISVS